MTKMISEVVCCDVDERVATRGDAPSTDEGSRQLLIYRRGDKTKQRRGEGVRVVADKEFEAGGTVIRWGVGTVDRSFWGI